MPPQPMPPQPMQQNKGGLLAMLLGLTGQLGGIQQPQQQIPLRPTQLPLDSGASIPNMYGE